MANPFAASTHPILLPADSLISATVPCLENYTAKCPLSQTAEHTDLWAGTPAACYDSAVKIRQNKNIESFLARCRTNLSDDRLNSFLDRRVTPGNEAYVRRALKAAGAQEFDGPENTWPGLLISVDDYEKTPYHRNVTAKLRGLHDGLYDTAVFAGGRLFNLDAVQPDKKRELGDWMKLRALDRDAETLVLADGDTEWMLDMPSEAATNDPFARKAYGNVLLFGLGIGYVLYMTLLTPSVRHITVVERDERVITRFRELLMPLFPDPDRFDILQDDAHNRWNAEWLSRFDCIFTDIWQSGEDGLFRMSELLSAAPVPLNTADFWIEDSCIVPLRTLVFLYFEELCSGTSRPVSGEYTGLMNNVRRWFETDSSVITEPEELKDRMYSRGILRGILGGRTCE